MVKRSWVWKYFKDEGKNARCEVFVENDEKCGSILQSAPKGLAEHLKRVHKIFPDDFNHDEMTNQNDTEKHLNCSDDDEKPVPKRQKTMKDYLKQASMEETIAYAAAVENHSFDIIAKSELIQAGLKYKFPNSVIPNCPKVINNMIYDFYLKVIESVIHDIDSLNPSDKNFSISLDEWISMYKKKYVNVNVHYNLNDEKTNYINTGLVKINDKCTSEQLFQLVKSHLASFHIDIEKDVISCSGDMADLMKEFGRQINLPYIIYKNHKREQYLSSSSHACAQQRSQMSDKMINTLFVLKSYFSNKK
ncbi:hypothetical protein PVAND_015202 [Polypedilum vanderplanki]|uniref:BED-type domain-containing protein n=1 Tax=Polypedilum vanderplanki TaxID=319348 RepID=A0A9J6BCD4_POLVA|nr:hypothetical protein PVAND_015202 [Polypedilum vanderplanki]